MRRNSKDDSSSRRDSPDHASERSSDGRRLKRVEKEILLQLSKYVNSAFQGELPGLLCLNRVQVTADLRNARIFFSIINGDDSDEVAGKAWLEHRAVEMQARLGREMKMRYTPKLRFEMDQSTEKALKVERMIHEISQQQKKDSTEE